MKSRNAGSPSSRRLSAQRRARLRWLQLTLILLLVITFAGPRKQQGQRLPQKFGGAINAPAISPVEIVFTVNSTGDAGNVGAANICDDGTGKCTLRAAIEAANANQTDDRINFDIPASDLNCDGMTRVCKIIPGTIIPGRTLPNITRPVTIDGYTQRSCAANAVPCSKTNTLAVGSDAVILIELDGTNAGIGLDIKGGNSTVKGLVINRFNQSGIQIDSSGNTIAGCFIGTDSSGSSAALTDQNNGVKVFKAINTIGGISPADRNVISGNFSSGVELTTASAKNNILQGNYIGTNKDGTSQISSASTVSFGVIVHNGASNNTIGGSTGTTPGGACTGACNLTSGQAQAGILVKDGNSTGNSIQGNFVGTNVTGTAAIPNSRGISIAAGPNNIVGGTTVAARNLISGNAGGGVEINFIAGESVTVQGNFIGTDTTGTSPLANHDDGIVVASGPNSIIGGTVAGASNIVAFNGGSGVVIANSSTGNAIRGNSIHDNGGLGIDLGSGGVTGNDTGDADTGPNALQNFPVITSATASVGAGNINGSLNSTPGQTFAIDFYANPACDPSGNGEGEIYLGSTTGTTDPTFGNVSFTFVSPPLTVGQIITATATDAAGNTSEFSSCVTVTPGCITSQPTDQTVCAGASASFSVSVSGASPTFQWRKGGSPLVNDGVKILGADTPTLTINSTSSNDDGLYDVVVNGTCSPPNRSHAAELKVNTAPSIIIQPIAQTVCAGSSVSFVAAANSSLAASVKWQESSNGGLSFIDRSADTNPTLIFTASAADNGKQYRAVFTNSCGSATTDAATLDVNTAPSITTQPTDQTVCPGSVTFVAAANGSPEPGVQWQEKVNGGSFINMPGPAAINPTLTFAADTSDDGNQYRAVFTNSCGSTTTNPASLTVTTPMLTITSRLRSPLTVPGNSDGRVVIPDLTNQVTAVSNCGLAISSSQLPIPGTQVGPEPTPVTITIRDSAGNTVTSESIINSDGDSDGIEASIDRNRTSQAIEGKIPSNDFVTRAVVAPAESSTSGTVTHRSDQNVHVIPSSVAGGVQASISGGTFGSIHPLTSINAFENPLIQIGLDTSGQIADITRNYPAPLCTQVFGGPSCLRTRVQALQTPLLHPIVIAIPLPRNRLTIDPRTDLVFRIALQQRQTVYVGSPITAAPANQGDIEIEILHNTGSVLGSLQLPPGQTVDIDQGASRELVVTNLDRAPLMLTFNSIGYTLSPGQALRPSLGPRAIYQEVLNDVTALGEKTNNKRDREKLNKAITHLIAALDPQLSTDAFHLQPKGGTRVFDEAKDAVSVLIDLSKNEKSSLSGATCQGFINALVNANRQLANIAIQEAVTAAGAQTQINKASEELSRGDRDVAAHLPAKLKNAIDHYRAAWKHAMNAKG